MARTARRGLATGLLVGGALALVGCARERAPASEGGAVPARGEAAGEASTAARAPRDLASATPENPLRPAADGPSARNAPGDPPEGPPRLDQLELPPGFAIEVYAARVPNARSLALGKRGTVFVSTRRDSRVYAVVDKDGDHRSDAVYTVARDLDTPNGIAYRDGSLYIAEIERLLRLDRIDGRLARPPRPVVVTDQLPEEEHHGWRYIRFGPDGLLYIGIGAPCNNCLREEPIFASIARMRADGKDLEVFASGVRNTVGFDWHPKTRELWFTENGRDELGDDLPPDELDRAPRAGMHFGYPHCHAGVILDPEFGDKPCTSFEPPVQQLGAHAAALGMRFYTGTMFPPEYRGAVLIAEHGSWNRGRKQGYRVSVVKLDGNRAVSYQPLVSGWLDEKSDEAWGRPVDVEVLDDGSVLVSDDWKGVLYRITYRG